jgi:hypothetical protein
MDPIPDAPIVSKGAVRLKMNTHMNIYLAGAALAALTLDTGAFAAATPAVPAPTLAAAAPPVTSSLASPAEKSDIKRGLKLFTEAADNTARLVMGKDYGAIAGQHEQVLEAKQIFDNAFTVDMKMKAESAVIKAVAASTTLKTVAADEDKAKSETAQVAFKAAVDELIALFPKDLQP